MDKGNKPKDNKPSSTQATGMQNPTAKKSVKFDKSVEIFNVTEAWKLQKQHANLKTEEEQSKRHLQYRNY